MRFRVEHLRVSTFVFCLKQCSLIAIYRILKDGRKIFDFSEDSGFGVNG